MFLFIKVMDYNIVTRLNKIMMCNATQCNTINFDIKFQDSANLVIQIGFKIKITRYKIPKVQST